VCGLRTGILGEHRPPRIVTMDEPGRSTAAHRRLRSGSLASTMRSLLGSAMMAAAQAWQE
jgi:hypothetical protein